MRSHSVFDPSTGLFTGNVVGCSDDQLAANVPAELRAMPGRFDHRSQRVDVVLLEASRGDHSEPADFVVDHQTPRPSPDHDWVAENPDALTRAGQRWRWRKKSDVVERERKDADARAALLDLDRQTVRALREASVDPRLVAIEAEAAELRKDVVLTDQETALAEQLSPP